MRKKFSPFLFGAAEDFIRAFNPLSANATKWSNILKQFVGKLPANCLSVFDYFVRLALRGLKLIIFSFVAKMEIDQKRDSIILV